MSRSQKRRGFQVPALLVPFAVVAGLVIFVAVLPLMAQSPEPSGEPAGPLVESEAHSAARALYDADGDGAIDVDEFLAAVRDHLEGRIDKATARLVMELHIGGSLAYGAAGTEKEWARIACIYIGCPIYPTVTPTPSPVAPLPPADTPTPTIVAPLPPSPSPWTPSPTPTPTHTPTPIPRLSNPCGHYDFNDNGKVDQSEVNQAKSDYDSGLLHRSDMLAVIACYLSAPKPKPPLEPTATHTHTPTPTNTHTPVPGETPSPTPGETPSPTPGETPSPTPVKPQIDTSMSFWLEEPKGSTLLHPSSWEILNRGLVRVDLTIGAGTDLSKIQFRVNLNTTGTGFSFVNPKGTCESVLHTELQTRGSAFSEIEDSSSSSTDSIYRKEYTVIRCSLGKRIDSDIRLYAKPDDIAEYELVTFTGIRQALHSVDGRIAYSTPTPASGLADNDGGLDFADELDDAAAAWNTAVKVKTENPNAPNIFITPTSSATTKVVIDEYTHDPTDPISIDKCGDSQALGCITDEAIHSSSRHILRQNMWIRLPPRGPNTEWTDLIREARENADKYYYLPQVLRHEFGHAAGLGHLKASGVMSSPYVEGSPVAGVRSGDTVGIIAVTSVHSH